MKICKFLAFWKFEQKKQPKYLATTDILAERKLF